MQEKQFVQKGARKVRLHEFLKDELEGAGYSHADIVRTPTSTKVVIYAQRPGLVIGRGGSRIKELTSDMEAEFNFENPQIEVNEIDEPDADAQVVAQSMADWLEKGGRAKRVGYTYLRRMKEAGVPGAEIEISGKLSGNRGRTEKFSFGYVKICGNTAKENVDRGYELARTKPGAIGVKVRMMEEMPDFMHRDVDVEEEIMHETVEGGESVEKAERISEIIQEADNMTAAEIEDAIETLEEVKTSDISKDEVRQVFEDGGHEETSEDDEEEAVSEEPEEEDQDESKADEEAPVEDTEKSDESEGDETEYAEIVSGTISDAKDAIDELEEPDFAELLAAEEADKNRTTFIDWLENKKE
ncbi:MAG: 30S ribosomal protein S3 [Nanohaloarchaea archaeon]|nr:30S ribosomal protein S3 [Candidatus Nanohaloarchaea archaeon]